MKCQMMWKVNLVKEITDIQLGADDDDGFTQDELSEIRDYVASY